MESVLEFRVNKLIAPILMKWSRIHVRLAPLSSALLGVENFLSPMGDNNVCDGQWPHLMVNIEEQSRDGANILQNELYKL